jgi:hypothetical protein
MIQGEDRGTKVERRKGREKKNVLTFWTSSELDRLVNDLDF